MEQEINSANTSFIVDQSAIIVHMSLDENFVKIWFIIPAVMKRSATYENFFSKWRRLRPKIRCLKNLFRSFVKAGQNSRKSQFIAV